MTTILVSIIVPIYIVEKEIDRCIQSIINQTHKNIEIILVDDGSPDNCPALCDNYAQVDKRIRVIHKKNGGLSDARNAGLRIATGEYILYVDSDDYIELDACERLLASVDDDIDFVVGVCKEIHQSSIIYQKHSNIKPGKKYKAKDFVLESIKFNEWYAPAWLNLYNREFLIKNNLYYKKGYIYEDIEMLPRLFLAANNIVYVDYSFYNYVIRENSIMTSENTSEKAQMSLDIFSNWFELLKKVHDHEYQKKLYGVMVRYYMAAARRRKIEGWKIEGMGAMFALKYAIGIRDKLKVIFFTLFPQLYIKTI